MSWLSSLGHKIGSIASNPWVKGATAGALALTGVGAPLSAAIMGGEGLVGGALKPGGNLGTALTGGTTGALEGYGASKLGGGIRRLGTGVLGATGTFGRGPVMDANGIDGQADIYDDPFGDSIGLTHSGSDGGGWGSFISGAARKLGAGLLGGGGESGGGGGLGGLGNLALGGLAGYQAYNAAQASKRAGQLSDKALGLAEQRWTDAAPLRSAGTARLLTPARPDLSGVFTDPSNPFASRPSSPQADARMQAFQQAPGGILAKLGALPQYTVLGHSVTPEQATAAFQTAQTAPGGVFAKARLLSGRS